MNSILLLEDEPLLCDMLTDFLTQEGFSITTTDSYDSALDLAYERRFDLFIFDVKILGGNGFELLKELRAAGVMTPCIFETSLNGIADIKSGFDAGCDDYIKKPYELSELLLRVQNILKRSFSHSPTNDMIKITDDLSFDIFQKRLISSSNNPSANLSKKESELLAIFLRAPNRVISRDELYSSLWDMGQTPSELSLRVYIRHLRQIIGSEKIVSHSRIGYEYRP